MTDLTQRVEALSPVQRALFELLLAKRRRALGNEEKGSAPEITESTRRGEGEASTDGNPEALKAGTVVAEDDAVSKLRGLRIELGEVEACLNGHRWIENSVVVLGEDQRLVAYVVPADEGLAKARSAELVAEWGDRFDELYRREKTVIDPTFNTAGWTSSYTGQPLPKSEMREWLDDAMARILRLEPRRVLEIGCGTGMLLLHLAPRVERYFATDISAEALSYTEKMLPRVDLGPDRVKLEHRSAERLKDLPRGFFDTVVLNSVVQYFPSPDYLSEVLHRAVEILSPGGALFIGDVRSLPLREAFYTSLELFNAQPELTVGEMRRKIEERKRQETELFIDPEFFVDLGERLPGAASVSVHPKRGAAHQELTAFRYQVVIRLNEEKVPVQPLVLHDWREGGWSIERLREHLHESAPKSLCFGNLPNLRTGAAAQAVEGLHEASEDTNLGEILGTLSEDGAVDPQAIWNLAASSGYEVELGWRRQGADGSFDVVLRRRDFTGPPLAEALPQAPVQGSRQYWSNHPMAGRLDPTLVPELRTYLAERLPEHMRPASYVALQALPLRDDLEIDIEALPMPAQGEERALVKPENPTEERLVTIWRELLAQEKISADDSFFDLGGHSQLAAQAATHIWREFGIDLPLRDLFEYPTVSALARRVEQQRREKTSNWAALKAVPRDRPLPLSWAQEALWERARRKPDQSFCDLVSLTLSGALRVSALHFAFEHVVRRHEILRTVFQITMSEESGLRPTQRIEPVDERPAAFLVVDLRALDRPEIETLRLSRALQLSCHLESSSFLRCLLIQREDEEYTMVFACHQMLFDDRSIRLLLRELAVFYRAAVLEQLPSLPSRHLQYADFAAWQRDGFTSEQLVETRFYWRAQLADLAVLDLPTDRPRSSASRRQGIQGMVVDASLKNRLEAMARAHDTSLFAILFAALQVIASRYSGQRSFALGTPIDERRVAELDGLIGPFRHVLVLRAELDARETWSDLLVDQSQRIREAFVHRALPFEGLAVEGLAAEELAEGSVGIPSLRAALKLNDEPSFSLEWPGLDVALQSLSKAPSPFEIELDFVDQKKRLTGRLEFRADLFDEATIERFIQHYMNLLEGVCEQPDQELEAIEILSATERRLLAQTWNQTSTPWPAPAHLPGLFATWASLTPNAVALIHDDLRLTYGELDRRSASLAGFLVEGGLHPEARLILALDRSPELIVAMLGTLRAGAAYAVFEISELEDQAVAEQIARVIDDVDADGILFDARTEASLQEALRNSQKSPLAVPIHQAWSSAAPTQAREIDPRQLAQIVYPSEAATGLALSHGSIVRLVSRTNYFRAVPSDRFAFASFIAEQIAIFEVWGCLLNGAGLVMLDPRIARSESLLTEAIRHHHLDVLMLSTRDFHRLVEESRLVKDSEPGLWSLYHLLVVGEAMDASKARSLGSRGKPRHLVSLHRPDDGVLYSAWYEVLNPGCEDRPLPIGRPLSNVELHVVAPNLLLAPIGVPGELLIGGESLGRGFWHRPRQTANRFVPHGLGDRVGQRLYRTGVLARRRENGVLEFLGRIAAHAGR